MAAPPQQERIVWRNRETTRERLDRLTELPRVRLCGAEVDEPLNVPRIGGQRALGASDRAGVGLRSIFDAGGRSILNGLRSTRSRENAAQNARAGLRRKVVVIFVRL
jgi:hypothetical protein